MSEHDDDPDRTLCNPNAPEGDGDSSARARRIGPFRLLERIGEGGMGEVWLADQLEPMRRSVALKIIKQGMDSRQVVLRFEAERQALAMMDHPAIAKVYDAGTTPNGRPYFAMEYVKGVPITQYCDRNKLSIRERIKLFIEVCEGVQHAHHKAVIHRDLKPGNVLVTRKGDRPAPKIIDFGVAKAMAQKLTDRTLHTQLGMIIGTPEYMSPEQADLTGEDIDTRTDVYALGVILYELLAGSKPFGRDELRGEGIGAMVQKIREEEPPRPSTRFNTLGDQSAEHARQCRTTPGTLRSVLAGDLDWITLKALEKDRARRYGSPQELAADLARYLDDQPVSVRPPDTLYRIGKFVRRHRGAVAAGLGILAVAFVGAAFSTWQAYRAIAAGELAAMERDEARRANDRAEEVKGFLTDMLRRADPSATDGEQVTLRDMLEWAGREIDDNPFDDTTVEAELRMTIGETYGLIGHYDEALPHLNRGLALYRDLGDAFEFEHARAVMAVGHFSTVAGKLEASQRVLSAYLDAFEAEEPEKMHANLLSTYGRVLAKLDRVDDAVASFQAAIDIYDALGDKRFSYTQCLTGLALALQRRGEGDLSIDMVEEAVQSYGAEDERPDAQYRLAYLVEKLGALRGGADDMEGAEREYRRSIDIRRRLYPEAGHPDMARTLISLGDVQLTLGKFDEAVETLAESVLVYSTLPGAYPEQPTAMMAHAAALEAVGRSGQARESLLAARELLLNGPPRVRDSEKAAECERRLRALADGSA